MSVTEYWKRCSAFLLMFPILLVSFLDLIIYIVNLKKYVFLFMSPLGLFYFSSIFYHLTFIIAAELQCISKLSSYLFLIFLLHYASVFWWWPPLFLHTLVNPFLPLYCSQFLLCGNTPPFQHTFLVFLVPCRGCSAHYSTFSWNKRVNKGEKGGKETCYF